MNTQSNKTNIKSIKLFCLFALLLSACSSTTRVSPPEITGTWKLPEGFEASTPVSCDEIGSLFSYDAKAPLDLREEKRYEESGLTVIEFSYTSPKGGRVPAILVLPEGKGPFAGIVFMHGSGGDRWSQLGTAKSYARLGAVGITISAPSARSQHDNFYPFTFRELDRIEQIQLIFDLRRAVDVLLGRPEVDPQRLAYLGSSYGGAMGGLLAGVEDRLKGYALEVGDGGLVHHFYPDPVAGLPGEKGRNWLAWMWPIEPIHYVGCAAPAELLFQNGTLDEMVSPVNALLYQHAGSEPKTIMWYEAGHSLNWQAFQDQVDWLKRIISLDDPRMAYPRNLRGIFAAWFLLTAVSMVFVLLKLRQMKSTPRGAILMWFLTILFLGPLGLVVFMLSTRRDNDLPQPVKTISPTMRSAGSAVWASTKSMCGAIIVLGFLLSFPDLAGNSLVKLISFLAATVFVVNFLLTTMSRSLSRSTGSFERIYFLPFLAEAVSTCLALAGSCTLFVALGSAYLSTWSGLFGFDFTYAPLWGVLSLSTLAGAVLTYPFHFWMIKRSVIRWG